MAIRHNRLLGDMPTGQERFAEKGREMAHLRPRFSFVVQQVLSQRTLYHLCRQGLVHMEAVRLPT